MPVGIYPAADWRPLVYATDPSPFAAAPKGWVLHVPVGNGSLFPYFNGLKSPNRKTSTGWVSKTGVVEQYVSTLREPWAQVAGNPWGTAWEVEGFPNERMTDAQLDALAHLHIWLGVPDLITDSPTGQGIGTHSMGGAAWGGHACPGPLRAAQRSEILARVRDIRNGADMPLTDTDVQTILNHKVALTAGQAEAVGPPYKAGDLVPVSFMLIWSPAVLRTEREMKQVTTVLNTKVDTLTAAITAISAGSPAAVTQAFTDGLAQLETKLAALQAHIVVDTP